MAKRARDAEEMKRRKQARTRFRNLIRSVALNRIWLVDTGDQKLSLNVKKNVNMLVRPPRKIGLLTMAEKSLMRIHYSLRTIEERKNLVTLVANLTCFAKITPKARARLCKVIKFMVIGEGRTLIKEGDPPTLVYFILTGEVEVSKKFYDHVTNSWVSKVVMIMGPGETIGEVELIERCARLQTFVSTNVVELLVLFEHDFDEILRDEMTKQWNQRKAIISALDYFKFFSKDQLISACKVSSLQEFNPLETIYYEDKGQADYTYFVISGECMILQCLKVRVSERNGSKFFEMVEIDKGSNLMFTPNVSAEVMRMTIVDNVKTQDYDIDELIASDETRSNMDLQRPDLQTIEARCQKIINSAPPVKERSLSSLSSWTESGEEGEMKYEDESEEEMEIEYEDRWSRMSSEFETRSSILKKRSSQRSRRSIYSELWDEEGEEEDDYDFKNLTENGLRRRSTAESIIPKRTINETLTSVKNANKTKHHHKRKKQTQVQELQEAAEEEYEAEENESVLLEAQPSMRSKTSYVKLPQSSLLTDLRGLYRAEMLNEELERKHKKVKSTLENHFIDVGSLTCGGIFGLGEKLEHRVIMARTTVQCLLMPRFWLLEKSQNPGNVWQRRRFYLDSTIPSRQSLFTDFLSTCQWQKFKSRIIKQCIDSNSFSNPTKIQDVPIICRIVEASNE
uniref:Cyclic nucleotide-binding domain-containing protein n=1 Tax=Glossina morsitans morsitans TaxID=37546 RepID=A0A1B0FQQ6_GLOMM